MLFDCKLKLLRTAETISRLIFYEQIVWFSPSPVKRNQLFIMERVFCLQTETQNQSKISRNPFSTRVCINSSRVEMMNWPQCPLLACVPRCGSRPWLWPPTPSPCLRLDAGRPGSCWALRRSHSSAAPAGASAVSGVAGHTLEQRTSGPGAPRRWNSGVLTCSDGDEGRGMDPRSFRYLLVSLATWLV